MIPIPPALSSTGAAVARISSSSTGTGTGIGGGSVIKISSSSSVSSTGAGAGIKSSSAGSTMISLSSSSSNLIRVNVTYSLSRAQFTLGEISSTDFPSSDPRKLARAIESAASEFLPSTGFLSSPLTLSISSPYNYRWETDPTLNGIIPVPMNSMNSIINSNSFRRRLLNYNNINIIIGFRINLIHLNQPNPSFNNLIIYSIKQAEEFVNNENQFHLSTNSLLNTVNIGSVKLINIPIPINVEETFILQPDLNSNNNNNNENSSSSSSSFFSSIIFYFILGIIIFLILLFIFIYYWFIYRPRQNMMKMNENYNQTNYIYNNSANYKQTISSSNQHQKSNTMDNFGSNPTILMARI